MNDFAPFCLVFLEDIKNCILLLLGQKKRRDTYPDTVHNTSKPSIMLLYLLHGWWTHTGRQRGIHKSSRSWHILYIGIYRQTRSYRATIKKKTFFPPSSFLSGPPLQRKRGIFGRCGPTQMHFLGTIRNRTAEWDGGWMGWKDPSYWTDWICISELIIILS